MKVLRFLILIALSLVVTSWSFARPSHMRASTANNPAQWPQEELDYFLELETAGTQSQSLERAHRQKTAESSKAIIAGTSGPFAVHAGFRMLQNGGNAADAALTSSLAQIALSTGAAISYAGILNVVYYDKASDKLYSLNAGYNTLKKEDDPLSIPAWGGHSGRTALVPGFMAGVQAFHDRFGKRPFAELFDPAIWIADHGVPFSPIVKDWLQQSAPFVTRLPDGARIFTKKNGQLYEAGDLFRQPELADTLKKIARYGAAYMYTGDWARHLVNAVQREGGKMTLNDLASYKVSWSEPLCIHYGDYEIASLGSGSVGNLVTLGSLKAIEVADLKHIEHYTRSADSLYYLTQIYRTEKALSLMAQDERRKFLQDAQAPENAQITEVAAQRVIDAIKSASQSNKNTQSSESAHTAAVIAIDENGDVAVVVHSLNGILWGTTGIFVDGVSIPDSAAFQQQVIADVGRGARLPNSMNPVIVLQHKKPVLASAAVGSGSQRVTVENLINILDFGMEPQLAIAQPNTLGPYLGLVANGPAKPEYEKETFFKGEFSETLLNDLSDRGQPTKVITDHSQDGYWIGIQLNHSNKLIGVVSPKLPSYVEGY